MNGIALPNAEYVIGCAKELIEGKLPEVERMTREEAARILQEKAEAWEGVLKHMTSGGDFSELEQIEDYKQALYTAIAALRGPQPDPITGLVPCGCGGVPVPYSWDETLFSGDTPCLDVTVACQKCGMGGNIWHESKLDAKNWWNAAMGWREGNEN